MRVMRRYVWPAPRRLGPGQYQPWSAAVMDDTPRCDRAPFEVPEYELDVVIGADAPEVNMATILAWAARILAELGIVGSAHVMLGANVLLRGEGASLQVTLWEAEREQQ